MQKAINTFLEKFIQTFLHRLSQVSQGKAFSECKHYQLVKSTVTLILMKIITATFVIHSVSDCYVGIDVQKYALGILTTVPLFPEAHLEGPAPALPPPPPPPPN